MKVKQWSNLQAFLFSFNLYFFKFKQIQQTCPVTDAKQTK